MAQPENILSYTQADVGAASLLESYAIMPLSVTLLGDEDHLLEQVNYPYAAQRQLNPRSMAHDICTGIRLGTMLSSPSGFVGMVFRPIGNGLDRHASPRGCLQSSY